MDEVAQEMLQSAGTVSRVYMNRRTGQRVDMFVIVGPSGPTAEHTPEVCVGGRYFTPLGSRRAVVVQPAENLGNPR